MGRRLGLFGGTAFALAAFVRAALALAALVLAVGGCCPGGVAVLESMTLTDETMPEGCRLLPPTDTTPLGSVPEGMSPLLTSNPLVTSDGDRVGYVSGLILPPSGGDTRAKASDRARSVNSVYVAVYGCDGAEGEVGVYAVFFREPTDAARRALLEANPEGVLFKGQLAAIVRRHGDGCDSCYDAVYSRVEEVMAR